MGKGKWRYVSKEDYSDTHHIVIYHVTYPNKTKMEYKLLLPKPYTKTWDIPRTHNHYLGSNMQHYKFGKSIRLTSKGATSKTAWREGQLRFANANSKKKNPVVQKVTRQPRRLW